MKTKNLHEMTRSMIRLANGPGVVITMYDRSYRLATCPTYDFTSNFSV